MSGHSKWSTIKRKKGALDAQRGKIFTKIAQMITMAAQSGGGDMETNFALRLAIEKAKTANMPKDNIERAIKRGTGEASAEDMLIEVTYEGYAPGGVAILVDTATNNRNRTVAEVRNVFDGYAGSMGSEGSVAWQFTEEGLVAIKSKKLEKNEKFGKDDTEVDIDPEEAMLELFDVEGVEDVHEIDIENEEGDSKKGFEIHCKKENLKIVSEAVEGLKYVVVSNELIKTPESMLDVDEETTQKVVKLVDALEELDDVQSTWVNIDLGD